MSGFTETDSAEASNEGTAGAQISNFQSSNVTTDNGNSLPPPVTTATMLLSIAESFDKYYATMGVIIALVGYIVIASTGNMNSIPKFIGYFLFLIFIFLSLQLFKNEGFWEKRAKSVKWIILSILLIIFILYQNFNWLIEQLKMLTILWNQ